jgi:uracil-DNA glycosylase
MSSSFSAQQPTNISRVAPRVSARSAASGIEKNGYLILPTFHPAFILRNNRERIRLWEDIGLVRGKLEELGYLPVLVSREMPTTRR